MSGLGTRHQRSDGELRQIRCGVLVSFAVYVLMIGIIPVLEHEVAWVNIGLAMALGSIAPVAAGHLGGRHSAAEGAA